MPKHEVYIESHLGGGAVMRNKRPAKRSVGIDLDPATLQRWNGIHIPNMELVNEDALTYLNRFSLAGTELIYVDPPYLPKTRRRERVYRFDYSINDHVALLDLLRTLPCAVMVSGYENELYNDMLSGWRRVTFNAKTHVEVRQESVWMNYAEPAVLHDARYLGTNFRERQQIQRRQATIRRRVQEMPTVERSEFMRWMNENFGSAEEGLCSVHG
ncbi:DNA adenine methylase [Xanthomonas sp. NCPPB 1638]|uniref:DNA adenine methylase n=1 Tax=Xanthomonas TaxID=338 RepID=UPI001AD67FE3|nr:DNA adenine methylase [Xanthomonas cucurbitae]WDM74795.1 DNA adenine methylase [Xanthomonas cucurbitae]